MRRPRVGVRRRAVVFLPNGFTLFNLFCGIYAIVKASRPEPDFASAAFFIVLGGVADTLDGRVARATGTGSRFGEELDSLVDAISFGFAPAMIVYFAGLKDTWDWIFVFIFTACAVMRLARFNVEQAGRAKTHFHGLPSPAAGMTLATYYWFSQTSLYNQTVILFTDSKTLAALPWNIILRFLMGLLAALMISDVPYPAVPSLGFKSPKQIFNTLVVLACMAGLIFLPRQFIFPALLFYVLYGAVKWAVLGFVGRRGRPDEIFWEEEASQFEEEIERETRLAQRSPSKPSEETLATGRAEPRQDVRRERSERSERPSVRAERPERAERPDRAERAERPDRSEDGQAQRKRRRRRGRGASRPPGSPTTSSSPPDSSPPPPPPPSSTET
jgi:CDP-diacylglycerol--serine O-phosphatidyltransferase